MRSAKVMAKAFRAGFHRVIHRACPVPLGSSPRVTRYSVLSAACSVGKCPRTVTPRRSLAWSDSIALALNRGGQPFGVQRDRHRVHVGEALLPPLDYHRLERARPVPRHLDGDLTGRIREHRLGPGAVADVPGENDKLIWPHCDTLILAAPSGARCLA